MGGHAVLLEHLPVPDDLHVKGRPVQHPLADRGADGGGDMLSRRGLPGICVRGFSGRARGDRVIGSVPAELQDKCLQPGPDLGHTGIEQVLSPVLIVPLEPGPEALDGAQAQGLADRIGDMQGRAQAEVEHGRLDQVLVRHLPQLLQDQGARDHIHGHIAPSALVFTEEGQKDHLIDVGKNIRSERGSPGAVQGLEFFIRQMLESRPQAELFIAVGG